ncbi:MAG: hypothetical protein SH807_09725 [Blastochloris sp.]|nr:hypothetical protein [Blastochloris sp.]
MIDSTVREYHVELIPFSPEKIVDFIKQSSKCNVRGGAICDYMHLCAARHVGVDRIFTLNKRHFLAIAPDLAPKIFHPSDVV